MPGVDGRLGATDEIDGWRDRCFARLFGMLADFSVTAEAGVASAFCVIVVVTRMVLGRVVVDSGVLDAAVAGVSGRELTADGVSTIDEARMGVRFLAEDESRDGSRAWVAAAMSSFEGILSADFASVSKFELL